jgi:hypothetical protein
MAGRALDLVEEPPPVRAVEQGVAGDLHQVLEAAHLVDVRHPEPGRGLAGGEAVHVEARRVQQRGAVPAGLPLERGGEPVDVRRERMLRVGAAALLEHAVVRDAVDLVVRRHRARVTRRPAVVGEPEPGHRLDVPAQRQQPGEYAVRAGRVATRLVRQRLREHGQHRVRARSEARQPDDRRRGPPGPDHGELVGGGSPGLLRVRVVRAERERVPGQPLRGTGVARSQCAGGGAAHSTAAALRCTTVTSATGCSSTYAASLAQARRVSSSRAASGCRVRAPAPRPGVRR